MARALEVFDFEHERLNQLDHECFICRERLQGVAVVFDCACTQAACPTCFEAFTKLLPARCPTCREAVTMCEVERPFVPGNVVLVRVSEAPSPEMRDDAADDADQESSDEEDEEVMPQPTVTRFGRSSAPPPRLVH